MRSSPGTPSNSPTRYSTTEFERRALSSARSRSARIAELAQSRKIGNAMRPTSNRLIAAAHPG